MLLPVVSVMVSVSKLPRVGVQFGDGACLAAVGLPALGAVLV
jgi:hypothetical protein